MPYITKKKGSRSTLLILLSACLVVFLPVCGSDTARIGGADVDLKGNSIAWVGSVDFDPRLKTDFDATVLCLKDHALHTRRGYPIVIVVNGSFGCNGTLACGCTEINGNSIYIDKQYLYTTAFTHEVVHWETGMGNEYHSIPQFNYCTSVAAW